MVSPTLTQPAPGWLSPARRVYAIGDVHGCADQLAAMHQRIRQDIAAAPPGSGAVIHLGDYIDRGPDSAAVVRRLIATPTLAGLEVVNLCGNHERMMLDALAHAGSDAWQWLRNGGEATLASWGVAPSQPAPSWAAALTELEHAFLHGLRLTHRIDGYVFVHAGLRPGVPFAKQSPADMLWIRDQFLNHLGPILPEAPDVAVVHGHTPAPHPEIHPHRIGIDTGAVHGGQLTCAVLQGRTVRFLTA